MIFFLLQKVRTSASEDPPHLKNPDWVFGSRDLS